MKLGLCAFALKGEHNETPLLPNIAVCMYILTQNLYQVVVAFLTISDQYHNFYFVKFVYKMASAGHFGFQKSLSVAFLVISDQYETFFYKMAAGAHFGCPKLTFDLISGHFRSIRNYFFKFLTIFDTQLIFFGFFLQNGRRQPFLMSEIHFQSHFWSFQIDRPFWIYEIHFR